MMDRRDVRGRWGWLYLIEVSNLVKNPRLGQVMFYGGLAQEMNQFLTKPIFYLSYSRNRKIRNRNFFCSRA